MAAPPSNPVPAASKKPAAWTTAREWQLEIKQRLAQQGDEARLSQEEIASVVALMDKMKNDGTHGTDPDFKGLVEIMRAYTKSQSAAQTGKTKESYNFSPEQLNILKYQVIAFKCLSKNAPIPPMVQHALQSFHNRVSGQSLVQQKIVEASVQRIKNKEDAHPARPALAQVKEHQTFTDPYVTLRSAGQYSSHRLLIPSIMPQGLDPISMAQERERRLRSRIAYRIAELESLPADMPNESVAENEEEHAPTKLKALIQLKALRLLEKQKKVRAEMISALNQSTSLMTAHARGDFRRSKKPSLRELRMVEKQERQQRMDREKKERQKQTDYLNNILQHGRDMLLARKALSQKQLKLGRAVLHWHSNIEKEEAKKQERMAKERIRALKADDEAEYLKLIDKQKDTRITHLLNQTDQYLEALVSLVADQQADISAKSGETMMPAVVKEAEGEDEDSKDYFGVAHRIREAVTEQPSILVGGNLKEYQLKGLEWMVSLYNNKLNGILADEMGLGKTIQTLSLVTYLIEKKNQNGPFLIIVPLSTMTNWTLEFEKWAPSVNAVIYKGNPNQRRAIQISDMRPGTFNAVLTTYEYIIKDKAFLSKIKWVYTIIDEGHRMKNASSKLSVTLTQFYSSRYRLILTGTPLQNNLPELWALLNFVLPRVFNSVNTFDEWFNTPFANTGERLELNEEEQLLVIKRLHKVLRPFLLRRLKKDVEADLPDKTERVLKTPLSALQQKLYNQIRVSGAMMTGGEGKKGIRSINNTIMQLRKVCNHPFVFDEVENTLNPESITDPLIYRVSGKFELLDRILPKLKATGHRVLIFFQMTAVMNIMEDFLQYRDLKYMRLDGTTKADDRSDMLKLFNAPDSDYFAFILSTRAGGLGLNLQSADTVIIFDSDWNPHQDLQAQDRAHRIGQTKEVRIYRLISANSIEESILARAQYKLDIDGKVIQAGKFDNRSTNEEREQYLRSLFDVNPEDANDINDVDDDEEMNEILARDEDELTTFRELDAQREKEDNALWKEMNGKGKYPRLISLDELPAVFLHDFVPEEEKKEEDLGRGRRTKDNVTYDDGLTEEQWTKAIDEAKDIDELVEKRRRRREKRLSKKADGESNDGTDMDVDSPKKRGTEDETTAPKSKKNGKGKNDEGSSIGKKLQAGASSSQTTVSEAERHALQKVFDACLGILNETTEVMEDGVERYQAELFFTLPSKKLYPDYYKIIKSPIAIDTIQNKAQRLQYHTVKDFIADIHLMFKNAKTYNMEGSSVWQDAVHLQDLVDNKVAELCPGGKLHVESSGIVKIRLSAADDDSKKRKQIEEVEEADEQDDDQRKKVKVDDE